MDQTEIKKTMGRIESFLIQIGKGYSLHEGRYGIWHIVDAKNHIVTSGSLPQIYARVENMAKEAE